MNNQWFELLERIKGYHPDVDEALLLRVYHRLVKTPMQRGAEGLFDPLSRALAVVSVLADLRLDGDSIAAGLLVTVVQSGEMTTALVRAECGDEIAYLVDGVMRVEQLTERPKSEAKGHDVQAEEYRKMILAMAQEIRVVLIWLALSLQRIREAARMPPAPVSQRLAGEVMDFYAPIAHRLGIHWIKSEMEDLAFRILQPESYSGLEREIEERCQGGLGTVARVVAILKKRLRKHGVSASVHGRRKHVYSVWCKLAAKGVGLDDLYDLVGYRIIVRKKSDCYRALGMIHSEFKPVPGRFKDYLALPKVNGYQSLHTVVFGPFENRIEVQIRTERMHQVAESGVAAHWSYKGRGLAADRGLVASGATGYAWLQRLLEEHQTAEGYTQFLENVKVDLFPDEVYVFTPAGRILTLPRQATPVDFAYAIHSEVGDHCQGSKVNGRMVPLKTILRTGDTVEILTSKTQHPNPHWLQFVASSRAKYCISRWEKNRQRESFITLGRELLEREIRKGGHGLLLSDKGMQKAAGSFSLSTSDDLLFQVGTQVLSPGQVVNRIFPELAALALRQPPAKGVSAGGERKSGGSGGQLRLAGMMPNLAVQAARCCSPLPGDSIVGIITTGRGITLHVADCANLVGIADQSERWIEDIDWSGEENRTHAARLRVMVANQRGVATQVVQLVADAKAVLVEMRMKDRDRDPCVLVLELEVTGRAQLELIMRRIRGVSAVRDVERGGAG